MEFRILGPLEAYDASGAAIRLPAGRERALVAALLLRRREVVSTDALIEALWGERPPTTASKAVQGYVSHLRRALGDGVLITHSPGYVLRVDVGSVDAERFEQLAAEGRRALEDADPDGALAKLDAALALWRGPALADFTFDDFAQSEIQRLTERRLETQESRIEALLELG
ncbi:MAG TPA: BTAD domain-containing putative transcriptional regulator, partial [Gaiella sp.]|nr:BTAD domain-containing putative transcriptional regulator [Gaiella sp.]